MVACDNQEFSNVTCTRRICWETSAGIEFYRLTVLDLITQIGVIIFIDILRVQITGKLEFNISKHVLDIVYRLLECLIKG